MLAGRCSTALLVLCVLQAGSEATQAVSTALEAACCCMQVLSAAGMHNSLYIDELMTAAVSLAKYQLQYNVLALHDPHYKRLYRPVAAAQGMHHCSGWQQLLCLIWAAVLLWLAQHV